MAAKRNHIYHKLRFRSLLQVKFTPFAPTFGNKHGRPTFVKAPGPGLLRTQRSTDARPWIIYSILWSKVLYSIMWSVQTQLFCYNTCIYSIRFLGNLSCRSFVSVLLQAVLFSLKIEDRFFSQFCKFKWLNTVKFRRVNAVRVALWKYIFSPHQGWGTSVQCRRLLQNDASARFVAWYATHNLLIAQGV